MRYSLSDGIQGSDSDPVLRRARREDLRVAAGGLVMIEGPPEAARAPVEASI